MRMQGWFLNLQTYVVATTYEEAFAVASALIDTVRPVAAVQDCTVRPYPKFEDQFSVRLSVAAPNLETAYRALLSALAADWAVTESPEEASAVWDARTNGPSPVTGMRWMHLNLFPLSDD